MIETTGLSLKCHNEHTLQAHVDDRKTQSKLIDRCKQPGNGHKAKARDHIYHPLSTSISSFESSPLGVTRRNTAISLPLRGCLSPHVCVQHVLCRMLNFSPD